MLLVCIIDSGIGIPRQDQAKVFDRLYRVDPTSRTKGLGLGLYICHRIVQYHNGTIGLTSEEGKGSTFWFKLPLHHTGSLLRRKSL
jgi:signal transduction histidine kinase